MSLINRMLRDLSSRQPPSGNVMSGIQLPQPEAPAAGAPLKKLGMLAVLVVAFTAGLWFMFGPKPVKIPQPRGLPPGMTAEQFAAAQTAAPATPAPEAGAESQPARLQMDTRLSTDAAPAEAAPATAPAEAAPQATPQATPQESPPPVVARAPAKPRAPRVERVPAKLKPSVSADEHYAQARRALRRGDDAAAEAELVEALAADPKLHAAREDLGTLRIRQGRLDDAESAARAGIEIDPTWIGYRRLVARLELARDRPAGAVAVLERDPPPVERDVEYHALLASAYQRVNRHEDAARAYRELARVQPTEANWWAGYAISRDALGDSAGALAGYAQARNLGGLDPRVLEHINRRTAALQAAG